MTKTAESIILTLPHGSCCVDAPEMRFLNRSCWTHNEYEFRVADKVYLVKVPVCALHGKLKAAASLVEEATGHELGTPDEARARAQRHKVRPPHALMWTDQVVAFELGAFGRVLIDITATLKMMGPADLCSYCGKAPNYLFSRWPYRDGHSCDRCESTVVAMGIRAFERTCPVCHELRLPLSFQGVAWASRAVRGVCSVECNRAAILLDKKASKEHDALLAAYTDLQTIFALGAQ